MEKTFQDLYTELQTETGDTSASKLISFKSWLNRGLALFQGRLGIQYNEELRTTDVAASQDLFQKPEDAIRIKNIRFNDGVRKYPLQLIIDDDKWQWLKTTTTTGTPQAWHPLGEDLYEIYPTPTGAFTGGLVLRVKVRSKPMSAADYVTGTATVNLNSQGVLGIGTTFTADMVGRKFRFQDGVGNGVWYKISGFTDATHITLENFYSGANVAGGAFTIGDIPYLPTELHTTLYDYAMWRYSLGKRNGSASSEYKQIWETDLQEFAKEYDADVEQQVFEPTDSLNITSNLMQRPEGIS